MIILTDMSDNQFSIDIPLIASIFNRRSYREVKLQTGDKFHVQETMGEILKLIFLERKYKT
jgi:hypothetical protein